MHAPRRNWVNVLFVAPYLLAYAVLLIRSKSVV